MELHTRNVNSAFRELVEFIAWKEGETGSTVIRKPYANPNGGGVRIQIDEPVMIHYSHPKERVLFNEVRDANPFAMLYEALWMLAGRNDVAPLAYYTKKFRDFSDDGTTLNGAYGYRWRQTQGRHWQMRPYGPGDDLAYWPKEFVWRDVDQLSVLINHLQRKPESSRAVLAMWNVEDDLLKIDSSRDVACNLDVVLSLRVIPGSTVLRPDLQETHITSPHHILDMTVFNRSNDLIWGALGANYVTFSILQEYVAAHLGVEVGRYTQATTNLHVYDWNWKPEEWLAERTQDAYLSIQQYNEKNPGMFNLVPLVKDPATFDRELPAFVERNGGKKETYSPCRWEEPFFNTVAQPMMTAFRAHKERWGGGTETWLTQIADDAWKIAAANWLRKRVK